MKVLKVRYTSPVFQKIAPRRRKQMPSKTPFPEHITINAKEPSQEAQKHYCLTKTSTINPSTIVPGNPKAVRGSKNCVVRE